MSNGEEDLKNSKKKQSTHLGEEKNLGPPPTSNLSLCVKNPTDQNTGHLYVAYQNPMRLKNDVKPTGSNEWLRSKIYSMSVERLAYLDSQNIPVLGIDKL